MPLFRIWFTRKVIEDCAIELLADDGEDALATFNHMVKEEDIDEISVWIEDSRTHEVINIEFDGEVTD